MKLSGIKYLPEKTKNPCLIHGSIKEKLSLLKIFDNFSSFGRPGFREAGTGPGSRAGPGKTKNNEKHFFSKNGQPGSRQPAPGPAAG